MPHEYDQADTMKSDQIKHLVADEVPHVSQFLKLTCCQCGESGKYDVGTIFYNPEGDRADRSDEDRYAFTNYFHCAHCGSPGPWRIADHLKLMGMLLRTTVGRRPKGFAVGRTVVFDGTSRQTPAMNEVYLKQLWEKDPTNSFLCTRLGNLLRIGRQFAASAQWYEKAIALDSCDVEARYHLHNYAIEREDWPKALAQARLFFESILEGGTTTKEDLDAGLVQDVARNLRHLRSEFVPHLPAIANAGYSRLVQRLIECLLNVHSGDEEQDETIIEAAADSVLDDEVEKFCAQWGPDSGRRTAPAAPSAAIDTLNLVASLREMVGAAGLNVECLDLDVPLDVSGRVALEERCLVGVRDGQRTAVWRAPALRELFRGVRKPPADLERLSEVYAAHFDLVEVQVLTICRCLGDRTDHEFEEVYSTLRRRPDGKSLGPFHDLMWQMAALLLGRFELSQEEFEALFGQLARWTRLERSAAVSRHYIAEVRKRFEQD